MNSQVDKRKRLNTLAFKGKNVFQDYTWETEELMFKVFNRDYNTYLFFQSMRL